MEKKRTIVIDGQLYQGVPAVYGQSCVNCDLGQTRCGYECFQFEEDEYDYVTLKKVDKSAI